jgi:transposase InsO family protein
VHQHARGAYGARRVHAELRLGRGIVVGHGAVAMLMRRGGLAGATGRPKWRHAKPDPDRRRPGRPPVLPQRAEPVVGDRCHRASHQGGQALLRGRAGCLSRRVVGWSIDASPTAALVTKPLGMAINTRTPPTGAIVHSNQGVQFASWACTQRAKDSGLVPATRLRETEGTAEPRAQQGLQESRGGSVQPTAVMTRHGVTHHRTSGAAACLAASRGRQPRPPARRAVPPERCAELLP